MKNVPLREIDPARLKTLIVEHVNNMLLASFDRWVPDADDDQIQLDLHTAQDAALQLASKVAEMIQRNYLPMRTPQTMQEVPRLRDLNVLMANAATCVTMSFAAVDGRKRVSTKGDVSFMMACMGCADKVLVDLLLEKAA